MINNCVDGDNNIINKLDLYTKRKKTQKEHKKNTKTTQTMLNEVQTEFYLKYQLEYLLN